MKVAITHKDGYVFQHFGHSEEFKIYEIKDNKVLDIKVVPTNGSGHGMLGGLLKELGVNVLICGGIGAGAINIIKNNNIEVYAGIDMSASEAIVLFLEGKLPKNAKVTCHHHDHECSHDCDINNRKLKLTRR